MHFCIKLLTSITEANELLCIWMKSQLLLNFIEIRIRATFSSVTHDNMKYHRTKIHFNEKKKKTMICMHKHLINNNKYLYD